MSSSSSSRGHGRGRGRHVEVSPGFVFVTCPPFLLCCKIIQR
jgi:hypothetical protein